MRLSLLLKPEHVFLDLEAVDRDSLLRDVAERLAAAGAVRDAVPLWESLIERERQDATVVGDDAAIPHCRVAGLKGIVVAFARSAASIVFDPRGGRTAHLYFFVLAPREQPAAHLQVLSNIAKLLRSAGARRALETARTPEALVAALTGLEAKL
ncbi:MAG: system, fructose-specific enzyme component [Acidobacteria bacterium]|nr:system, fructose-specific enzyme component [Acidobacteriota bacterium]